MLRQNNEYTCTSTLRPSTTVPFSFSRALSASALFWKVTKPNPYMHEGKKIRRHALKFVQTNQCQYMYLCNNHSQSFKLKHITHASDCIIHDSTWSSEVKQGVT